MSSPRLRILKAEPDDLDSDLDNDSPTAETALLQGHSRSRDVPHPPPRHRHYVWVISVCLCAAFLIEIGDVMQRTPLTRVLEDILCQQYYNSTGPMGTQITLPIPEEDCKMPEVQSPLAMLLGWDSTISCIPGLFLALPCGYIADRYGRKIVLLVCLLGLVLKLLWIQILGKTPSLIW
jgi:MFS family permease